jgi:hypothetical protein
VRSVVVLVFALTACNDIRDFTGRWEGRRVGDTPALRVGKGDAATLEIDGLDTHGIRARVIVDGLFGETRITSLPGAEADALANLTFPGNPFRVFLAFATVDDGNGDAFVMIGLYDDERVDLRVLRGGLAPVYAIFGLERSTLQP